MAKTAKKRDVGRPKGAIKVPLNVSILKDRKNKLKKLAIDRSESASSLVENALDFTYGI